MKLPLTATVLVSALALSACATTPPPPSDVQVTRFAAPDRQIADVGVVSVVAAPGQDRALIAPYLEAVTEQFSLAGLQVVAPRNGIARAEVRVEQSVFAEGRRRSPVTVGGGASTGSYGSGVGVGLGINLGGSPKDFLTTTLGVMVRDAATADSLWEGRASWDVREDAEEADDVTTADNLAAALFEGFPDNAGDAIGAP